MTIAVSGHQELWSGADWESFRIKAMEELGSRQPFTMYTCLAHGADQMFATCSIELNQEFVAVLPFPDYERTFKPEHVKLQFLELLQRATRIETLDRVGSDEDCYLNAASLLLDRCDLLMVLWDGKPAKGAGGTGDVVTIARDRGLPIVQL